MTSSCKPSSYKRSRTDRYPYEGTLMSVLVKHGIDNAVSLGMTSDMIAERVGVDKSYLSAYKYGAQAVAVERIEALSEVLDIPLSNLVEAGIKSYPAHKSWRAVRIVVQLFRPEEEAQ